MAISTNSVWEVRSAGSDTQGGVWDSTLASAGTDYSQQNTAQLSLTDVVTTSTTTVTSVTGGFTATMIANGINIAGTIYQITAVASTNSITVDRATGTGTGQTGKVGGACGSPGYVSSQVAAGNWIYVAASGGYTLGNGTPNTAGNKIALAVGGTLTRAMRWIGYNTTRTDQSAPVVLTAPTGVGTLFSTSSATGIVIVDNFTCDSSNTAAGCFAGAAFHKFLRCKATRSTGVGFSAGGNGTSFMACEATACATGFSGRLLCRNCNAHACTGVGFSITTIASTLTNCLSYGNGSHGYSATIQTSFVGCTSYGNTGSGFLFTMTTAALIEAYNCLSYGNGASGFANGNSNDLLFTYSCAAGNNTSGGFSATINQEGSIALTADPFTNAAGGDFSLNVAASGGALVRGTGVPGLVPGSASTSYPDIGAIQHAGGSLFGSVSPARGWVYVG